MPAVPQYPSPIVLLGFMGCGKTTVGRALAQRLGWHFTDLDDEIEAAAGASIAAIFSQRGEPAFRQIELRQLQQVLAVAARRPTVVALGGGTFAQPGHAELIHGVGTAATVFLEVSVETLLQRCAGMRNRPLFRDETSFRALYEHRLTFYRQARQTVNGAGEPAAVSERVLQLWAPAGPNPSLR